jgi:hypothetical protein
VRPYGDGDIFGGLCRDVGGGVGLLSHRQFLSFR